MIRKEGRENAADARIKKCENTVATLSGEPMVGDPSAEVGGV